MNLFPPLIGLLILIACALFLWRRRVAGAVLFAVTIIMVLVVAIFCGVERHYDEQMTYELTDFGSGSSFPPVVRFTNSHGDSFSGGSAAFAERLKQTRPPTVRVAMTATYDFGRFRAYHISRIDGETP
jgi:hypothetical protein